VRHVDPDTLALLALGEDAATRDDAAHLAGCAVCSAELADLRRIVAAGRETTPADVPTAPPPVVWERIRAELGLGAATGSTTPPAGVAGTTTLTGAAPTPPTAPHLGRDTTPAAGPVPPAREERGADVVDLASRRRHRRTGWLAVAAAAAGIVVGGAGGVWWASRPGAPEEPTVLAQAALEPLPGWAATGVASLEEDPTGSRAVVVEVQGDLGTDGFREVWLLAPDLSGMVSLGLLEGSTGRFVLPEGIDVSRYSVVDVSEEPFDGDATHSGNSVVRGALDA
jgi:hypothetical protein